MALQARLHHQKGRHVAQHFPLCGLLHALHFPGSLLKTEQGVALPVIRCVFWTYRAQAGQAEDGARIGLGHLGNQPRHVGRVDKGQCLAVGGGDLAARMVQIGIGLGGGGYWHIDAAVAGVPAAREHHHAEHIARTGRGDLDALAPDIVNVQVQRKADSRHPQSQHQQPVASLADKHRHVVARQNRLEGHGTRH